LGGNQELKPLKIVGKEFHIALSRLIKVLQDLKWQRIAVGITAI
jgi:hypothetical protein